MRAPTTTFGLKGESEVVGGTGAREATCQVWLFNGYSTGAACQTAINTLVNLVNKTGTLAETGNITRNFANVNLVGVDIDDGPIPVTGSSVRSGYSGWMAVVTLRFRQLKVPA